MEYGTFKAFGKLRHVLMHKPETELELLENPNKWGFESKPNQANAGKEFDNFVEVLQEEGVKVTLIEAEEIPSPNVYYTRDLGLCTQNGLILSNFRFPYRQGEELYLQIAANQLGIPIFGSVRNAFFEGGDYIRVSDDMAALGLNHSSYTGYEEIAEFLDDHKLVPVPLKGDEIQLGALFSMLSEETAVVCSELLPKEFLDFLNNNEIDFVDVSVKDQQKTLCDVIRLGNNKLIIADESSETKKSLESKGFDVITLNLHELIKGRGGASSMALELLRK